MAEGSHICTWKAGWEEGKNPALESASEITDIRKVLSTLSAVHVFIHVSLRLSRLISGTECVCNAACVVRALYRRRWRCHIKLELGMWHVISL